MAATASGGRNADVRGDCDLPPLSIALAGKTNAPPAGPDEKAGMERGNAS